MNEETDCGLACLIRSFDKTRETAYAYIEELANNAKTVTPIGNRDDIADDIFMPQSALQNSGTGSRI